MTTPIGSTRVATNLQPQNIADGNQHTVGKGDTLESIAAQHNISVEQLIEANPALRENATARQGMVLTVPTSIQTAEVGATGGVVNNVTDTVSAGGVRSGAEVGVNNGVTAPVTRAGQGGGMLGLLGGQRAGTTVPTGKLGPTNNSLALTPRMAEVVKPADQALDLAAINAKFNPLKDTIGDFTKPSEMYQGKAFIPVRDLIGGGLKGSIAEKLKQAGVPDEQLEAKVGEELAKFGPMLSQLSESAVMKNSAHQFNVDGNPGNRVTLYGGERGHKDIDQVVDEMGKQHMRGLKIMSHIDKEGQGGKISDILEDGVLGVTHTGGFSAGVRGGEPLSIKSDWPSDYGSMDNNNVSYNAVLVGVDYQAGTKLEVPEKDLKQYKHNGDMWDVAAGVTVPFANRDPDRRHQDYKFNPLEVRDHETAVSVGNSLAKLDWKKMKEDRHGAFYCAEAQEAVASLAPKGDLLLKESKYGDTPLGDLINSYQDSVKTLEADPGKAWGLLKEGKVISESEYAANKDKPISVKDWPQAGWLHLVEKGSENGGINQEQYKHLADTDRTATFMEFVPEDTKGWENFEPYQKDGLIANPMTVATMGWGLIRSTIPRQEVAKTVAKDVATAYAKGDDAAKAQIKGLLNGHAPDTAEGKAELQKLGMKSATGLILNAVKNPDFKTKMLKKAGFEEIIDEQIPDPDNPGKEVSSKKLVERTFDKFIDVLSNPALMADQKAFDAAIKKVDDAFREMNIKRTAWNEVAQDYSLTVEGPMVYAAPNSMLLYSRNPDLFDSQAFRYVTNLQHVKQAGE